MTGSQRLQGRTMVAVAALTLALGVAFALRAPARGGRRPPTLSRELSLGARFADSLERVLATTAPAVVRPSDALAALYLERLRLGLGSPFRLVDYALRDPMLDPAHRRPVAEALLARTALGEAYQTLPEALQLLAPVPSIMLGAAHRRLIESSMEEAESPRAAELALRLTYAVGASSGKVSHRATAVAVSAIAQARDRILAMRDLSALLAAARAQDVDPVDLVPVWRADRRFAVELPLLNPPTALEERTAATLLPVFTARLDSLHATAADTAVSGALGNGTTAALAVVAARAGPPQAPVTVTLGGYAAYVVAGGRSPADRAARSAFVARASNEEAMAAELARLQRARGVTPEASLAVLTAAVALRTYAQEKPWFPGDGGPSPFELQTRYGLAALSFDKRVPAPWRPYYTRMLESVVRDVRTVFPMLDLSGLHVHFGDSPMKDRALALHDPGTRTVYFPLATAAGAMAHELAHDLDWQAARRRYGIRGGYRTDRSVRQYRDDFTATVRRLASAAPRRDSSSTGGERPTEAFARGVDWFVASVLAHQGRLNGYVSAVQDETLTGYASATAPRLGGGDAVATLDALREIADVDPRLSAWYDEMYGQGRRFGVTDAVRRVLTAPLPPLNVRGSTWMGFDAFSASYRTLRASPEAGRGWECLLESPSMHGRDAQALRSVMRFAAESRSRGLVNRWGDYARSRPDASWRFRALGGAPWSPSIGDSIVREVRDAMLWRAARVDDGRVGMDLAERAERRAAWERCAAGER